MKQSGMKNVIPVKSSNNDQLQSDNKVIENQQINNMQLAKIDNNNTNQNKIDLKKLMMVSMKNETSNEKDF